MGAPALKSVQRKDGKMELVWTYFSWPDADGYIYNESEHEDEWVAGYSESQGSISKEADHLYLRAYNDHGRAERAWVTDSKVKVDNFDTLKIDWENVGDFGSRSAIVVSDSKSSDMFEFDARLFVGDDFERVTQSVDIEDLSGDYYIRVHTRDMSDSHRIDTRLLVYKIWLE